MQHGLMCNEFAYKLKQLSATTSYPGFACSSWNSVKRCDLVALMRRIITVCSSCMNNILCDWYNVQCYRHAVHTLRLDCPVGVVSTTSRLHLNAATSSLDRWTCVSMHNYIQLYISIIKDVFLFASVSVSVCQFVCLYVLFYYILHWQSDYIN